MNDNEIHECIDKKNDALFDRVEGLIDRYTTTITGLITEETGQLRHSVNELTRKVENQNGSVRDLQTWRSNHIGEEDGKHKVLIRWLQVGAFIVTCVMAYIGYRNLNFKATRTMRDVNDMAPAVMRGQHYDPFANDTIK